ncbi:VOC family protein [uncultured Hyphomonas sp.]|uniref:VOC family protein n=1 Tax=uncultured Hyphomonas sp. TaxID=225298 RepID=UPI002AAB7BBB|nr:VOC family protein [uncultured Hyphomonas sp.]
MSDNNQQAEFEFQGVNHLALVCKDMARTVEFYRDKLGMKLTKTLNLPFGMGQHFFFDVGNGDSIAFFWFPDAPEAAPGIAAPQYLPMRGPIASAHGSMNHIAINVPAEHFDDYCEKLKEKGVDITPVMNHDDSPMQMSPELHDDVFVRSVYFFDPDGICLEFAAWHRPLTPARDVIHDPVGEDGTPVEGVVTGRA